MEGEGWGTYPALPSLQTDPTDLVARALGEPEGAVGTRHDVLGVAVCGGNGVLADRAGGGDAADLGGMFEAPPPAVMPAGWLIAVGMVNVVGVAVVKVEIRPILLPLYSVNQRLPSGPTVMP
jgi:hypothetical protein